VEKTVFVNNLVQGQETTLELLVLKQTQAQTVKGSLYLSLELGDRTGRIQAKVWDEAYQLSPILAEGQVVLVQGLVEQYKGILQLNVKSARLLSPGDFQWPDFLKSAPRPTSEMKKELLKLVDSIPDTHFRVLVRQTLSHIRTKDFWTIPAAKNFHHAYIGGLLEHTLSVTNLAIMVSKHYGSALNKSLLMSGAILHDVGKCWEFSTGPATDYTTEGRLLGHLSMGAAFLSEIAETIHGFPALKLQLLQHLILSHHGTASMGSPQTPKLIEALLLHHLDNLDAKLNAAFSFIETDAGKTVDGLHWTSFHRLFETFFMRTPSFEKEAVLPADSQVPESSQLPSGTPDPRTMKSGMEFS
jgi:3'-5' exoribonuclease